MILCYGYQFLIMFKLDSTGINLWYCCISIRQYFDLDFDKSKLSPDPRNRVFIET